MKICFSFKFLFDFGICFCLFLSMCTHIEILRLLDAQQVNNSKVHIHTRRWHLILKQGNYTLVNQGAFYIYATKRMFIFLLQYFQNRCRYIRPTIYMYAYVLKIYAQSLKSLLIRLRIYITINLHFISHGFQLSLYKLGAFKTFFYGLDIALRMLFNKAKQFRVWESGGHYQTLVTIYIDKQ